jgi:flavin reductase (DIM6/NTAB) family NADH-FMN oxidoreductase RutF
MLSEHQSHLAKIFAGRPDQGAEAYDFGEGKWKETHNGLPVLEGATATFICDLEKFQDVGTHRVFLGHVIEANHIGASPLVYSGRKFGKFLEQR